MALRNSLGVEIPFCATTVLGRHSTMLTWLNCIQTQADEAAFVLCQAQVSTNSRISSTPKLLCCFFLGPHCFREGGEIKNKKTWVILEK